jgi:hypothetical protein
VIAASVANVEIGVRAGNSIAKSLSGIGLPIIASARIAIEMSFCELRYEVAFAA